MLTTIRKAINGKKTYILGTVAVVTAIVAWAAGGLDDLQLIGAVFAALQSMFIRAGIAKSSNGTN